MTRKYLFNKRYKLYIFTHSLMMGYTAIRVTFVRREMTISEPNHNNSYKKEHTQCWHKYLTKYQYSKDSRARLKNARASRRRTL